MVITNLWNIDSS